MTQNAMHLYWTNEEVDAKLHQIMSDIHEQCVAHGREGDYINYVKGANVAGFLKVAQANARAGRPLRSDSFPSSFIRLTARIPHARGMRD